VAGNEKDATLEIVGLNERTPDFDGDRVVFRDMEGDPVPEELQPTLGSVLLGLIRRPDPRRPLDPVQVVLLGEAGEGMAAAMKGDGRYTIGSEALQLLRDLARANVPGFQTPLMLQVHRAIGIGKAGAKTE
jgi:hypothetical protein